MSLPSYDLAAAPLATGQGPAPAAVTYSVGVTAPLNFVGGRLLFDPKARRQR